MEGFIFNQTTTGSWVARSYVASRTGAYTYSDNYFLNEQADLTLIPNATSLNTATTFSIMSTVNYNATNDAPLPGFYLQSKLTNQYFTIVSGILYGTVGNMLSSQYFVSNMTSSSTSGALYTIAANNTGAFWSNEGGGTSRISDNKATASTWESYSFVSLGNSSYAIIANINSNWVTVQSDNSLIPTGVGSLTDAMIFYMRTPQLTTTSSSLVVSNSRSLSASNSIAASQSASISGQISASASISNSGGPLGSVSGSASNSAASGSVYVSASNSAASGSVYGSAPNVTTSTLDVAMTGSQRATASLSGPVNLAYSGYGASYTVSGSSLPVSGSTSGASSAIIPSVVSSVSRALSGSDSASLVYDASGSSYNTSGGISGSMSGSVSSVLNTGGAPITATSGTVSGIPSGSGSSTQFVMIVSASLSSRPESVVEAASRQSATIFVVSGSVFSDNSTMPASTRTGTITDSAGNLDAMPNTAIGSQSSYASATDVSSDRSRSVFSSVFSSVSASASASAVASPSQSVSISRSASGSASASQSVGSLSESVSSVTGSGSSTRELFISSESTPRDGSVWPTVVGSSSTSTAAIEAMSGFGASTGSILWSQSGSMSVSGSPFEPVTFSEPPTTWISTSTSNIQLSTNSEPIFESESGYFTDSSPQHSSHSASSTISVPSYGSSIAGNAVLSTSFQMSTSSEETSTTGDSTQDIITSKGFVETTTASVITIPLSSYSSIVTGFLDTTTTSVSTDPSSAYTSSVTSSLYHESSLHGLAISALSTVSSSTANEISEKATMAADHALSSSASAVSTLSRFAYTTPTTAQSLAFGITNTSSASTTASTHFDSPLPLAIDTLASQSWPASTSNAYITLSMSNAAVETSLPVVTTSSFTKSDEGITPARTSGYSYNDRSGGYLTLSSSTNVDGTTTGTDSGPQYVLSSLASQGLLSSYNPTSTFAPTLSTRHTVFDISSYQSPPTPTPAAQFVATVSFTQTIGASSVTSNFVLTASSVSKSQAESNSMDTFNLSSVSTPDLNSMATSSILFSSATADGSLVSEKRSTWDLSSVTDSSVKYHLGSDSSSQVTSPDKWSTEAVSTARKSISIATSEYDHVTSISEPIITMSMSSDIEDGMKSSTSLRKIPTDNDLSKTATLPHDFLTISIEQRSQSLMTSLWYVSTDGTAHSATASFTGPNASASASASASATVVSPPPAVSPSIVYLVLSQSQSTNPIHQTTVALSTIEIPDASLSSMEWSAWQGTLTSAFTDVSNQTSIPEAFILQSSISTLTAFSSSLTSHFGLQGTELVGRAATSTQLTNLLTQSDIMSSQQSIVPSTTELLTMDTTFVKSLMHISTSSESTASIEISSSESSWSGQSMTSSSMQCLDPEHVSCSTVAFQWSNILDPATVDSSAATQSHTATLFTYASLVPVQEHVTDTSELVFKSSIPTVVQSQPSSNPIVMTHTITWVPLATYTSKPSASVFSDDEESAVSFAVFESEAVFSSNFIWSTSPSLHYLSTLALSSEMSSESIVQDSSWTGSSSAAVETAVFSESRVFFIMSQTSTFTSSTPAPQVEVIAIGTRTTYKSTRNILTCTDHGPSSIVGPEQRTISSSSPSAVIVTKITTTILVISSDENTIMSETAESLTRTSSIFFGTSVASTSRPDSFTSDLPSMFLTAPITSTASTIQSFKMSFLNLDFESTSTALVSSSSLDYEVHTNSLSPVESSLTESNSQSSILLTFSRESVIDDHNPSAQSGIQFASSSTTKTIDKWPSDPLVSITAVSSSMFFSGSITQDLSSQATLPISATSTIMFLSRTSTSDQSSQATPPGATSSLGYNMLSSSLDDPPTSTMLVNSATPISFVFARMEPAIDPDSFNDTTCKLYRGLIRNAAGHILVNVRATGMPSSFQWISEAELLQHQELYISGPWAMNDLGNALVLASYTTISCSQDGRTWYAVTPSSDSEMCTGMMPVMLWVTRMSLDDLDNTSNRFFTSASSTAEFPVAASMSESIIAGTGSISTSVEIFAPRTSLSIGLHTVTGLDTFLGPESTSLPVTKIYWNTTGLYQDARSTIYESSTRGLDGSSPTPNTAISSAITSQQGISSAQTSDSQSVAHSGAITRMSSHERTSPSTALQEPRKTSLRYESTATLTESTAAVAAETSQLRYNSKTTVSDGGRMYTLTGASTSPTTRSSLAPQVNPTSSTQPDTGVDGEAADSATPSDASTTIIAAGGSTTIIPDGAGATVRPAAAVDTTTVTPSGVAMTVHPAGSTMIATVTRADGTTSVIPTPFATRNARPISGTDADSTINIARQSTQSLDSPAVTSMATHSPGSAKAGSEGRLDTASLSSSHQQSSVQVAAQGKTKTSPTSAFSIDTSSRDRHHSNSLIQSAAVPLARTTNRFTQASSALSTMTTQTASNPQIDAFSSGTKATATASSLPISLDKASLSKPGASIAFSYMLLGIIVVFIVI